MEEVVSLEAGAGVEFVWLEKEAPVEALLEANLLVYNQCEEQTNKQFSKIHLGELRVNRLLSTFVDNLPQQ